MTRQLDVFHRNSASVTGASLMVFLILSPPLPNLLLILAAGNPRQHRGSCDCWPSHKQRTESAKREKLAKIRVFRSLAPFAGNHETPQTLAFSAGLKKARAASDLGKVVEVSGIEPLASTLRTSRSPN